ncbi:hypothetical protein Q3G72_010969 [Acer saccharum]|nr:hypothetical protein Q3G72_010969 [Acer saccharum]
MDADSQTLRSRANILLKMQPHVASRNELMIPKDLAPFGDLNTVDCLRISNVLLLQDILELQLIVKEEVTEVNGCSHWNSEEGSPFPDGSEILSQLP